jgi:hypothetical protein
MNRKLQNRTEKRVSVAVGLLAAVLALLGSQQLSRGGSALPSDLGDIAYRAAPFGTLAGEHQQASSGRQR